MSALPGLTFWSRDFCNHGTASLIVESLQIRVFIRAALIAFTVINHQESISELKEHLVTEFRPTWNDWMMVKLNQRLKPGDCLGWHFQNVELFGGAGEVEDGVDMSSPRRGYGGESEESRVGAGTGGARIAPVSSGGGAGGHGDNESGEASSVEDVDRSIRFADLPADAFDPAKYNNSTHAATATGLCESITDVSDLYNLNARLELQKRRKPRSWIGRRLFVVSACNAGLKVVYYRVAPSIKFCLDGEEQLTMSQKRVVTSSIEKAAWWFTRPSYTREKFGLTDDLANTFGRKLIVDPTVVEGLLNQYAHKLSAVCAYLDTNHPWAPDTALAKTGLRCPKTDSTFVAMGNNAWQFCWTELINFLADVDVAGLPGPTAADLNHAVHGFLQGPMGEVFKKRIMIEYEIPQYEWWVFSTRGRRYSTSSVLSEAEEPSHDPLGGGNILSAGPVLDDGGAGVRSTAGTSSEEDEVGNSDLRAKLGIGRRGDGKLLTLVASDEQRNTHKMDFEDALLRQETLDLFAGDESQLEREGGVDEYAMDEYMQYEGEQIKNPKCGNGKTRGQEESSSTDREGGLGTNVIASCGGVKWPLLTRGCVYSRSRS